MMTTAMQHSQGSLHHNFVDFSRCSMPPPDWHIDLLGLSTSHRCCGTCTGCSLGSASTSSQLCLSMPAQSGATVSLRSHPVSLRFQPPPSPVIVFVAASDPTHMAVHCRRSCVSSAWKPPLKQSAARRHLRSNAHCFLEPPQDLPCFQIISLTPVVCI